MTPARHPAARTPAGWVSSSLADRLEAAGLTVWRDPLRYVFAELEHQLRMQVSEFFGVDVVADLVKLHEAAAEADGGRTALAAVADLGLLTATIRLLLRRGTSVRAWPALLAAVGSCRRPAEAAAAYERTAPGETITEPVVTVPVPAGLADIAAREAGGARPRAAEVFSAMDELRQVVSTIAGPIGLAIQDPLTKEIVHRYASREFPDIAVVLRDAQAVAAPKAEVMSG